MLSLDDPRWNELKGGYRALYDPRPALTQLESGTRVDEAWLELWDELHHQGDVGLASYAAVPHLVRIHRVRAVADDNTYSMLATIELERGAERNPAIPDWLAGGYEQAWSEVVALALGDLAKSSDPDLHRCALGVVALAKGLRTVGLLITTYMDDELEDMLEEHGS